jgi:hypothetical protein
MSDHDALPYGARHPSIDEKRSRASSHQMLGLIEVFFAISSGKMRT